MLACLLVGDFSVSATPLQAHVTSTLPQQTQTAMPRFFQFLLRNSLGQRNFDSFSTSRPPQLAPGRHPAVAWIDHYKKTQAAPLGPPAGSKDFTGVVEGVMTTEAVACWAM